MKNYLKQHIVTLSNLCVVILIAGPFFLKSGYLFFTDYSVGPHIKPSLMSGWFLLDSLFVIIGPIVSIAFLQKMLVAGTIAILLVAGNRIARLYTERTSVIIAVGFFLVFNPFVYERLLFGQIGVILALGFFAWGTAQFLSWLTTKRMTTLIGMSILWGLSVLMSHHFIFIIFATVAIIGSFLWRDVVSVVRSAHFFKYAGYGLGILLLINATWIGALMIPGYGLATKTAMITKQDFHVFEMSGSSDGEALKLGVMMSGFWGKDQHRFIDSTQDKNLWGRGFVILLPLFLIGIYALFCKEKTRRYVIALGMLYIVGVFLALGVKTGFTTGVTEWLLEHVPFYAAMRETSKWIGIVVFTYAVFLTTGLDWILSRISQKGISRGIIVLVFIATILQAPLLLNGFGRQVVPTRYPEEWSRVDTFLVEQNPKCEHMTLFLPWHLYMSFDWMPRVIENPVNTFFSCPVITGTNIEWKGIEDNSGDPTSRTVVNWLTLRGDDNGALQQAIPQVKYVMISKSLDWQIHDEWLRQSDRVRIVFEGPSIVLYEFK